MEETVWRDGKTVFSYSKCASVIQRMISYMNPKTVEKILLSLAGNTIQNLRHFFQICSPLDLAAISPTHLHVM